MNQKEQIVSLKLKNLSILSAEQSPEIHICLLDANKIKFIQEITPVQQDESQPGLELSEHKNNDMYRNKYYQLCGLLWKMHQSLGNHKSHRELANTIQSCFSSSTIDKQEGLNEYEALQRQHPDRLKTLTKEDLKTLEFTNYNLAYKAFEESLNKIQIRSHKTLQSLYDKGKSLAKSINDKVQRNPEANLKFYASVLEKSSELVDNENYRKPHMRQEYAALIENEKEGKPSLCKKIFGCLLMFLGAAIAAASIVAKVASLGISTPVSTAGICVGSVTFLAGLGLFRSGCQKGTSLKMTEFHRAAEQAGIERPIAEYKEEASFGDTLEGHSETAYQRLAPSLTG